jgi:hypothetical protein
MKLWALAPLTLLACATVSNNLPDRAALDMRCPQDQLTIVNVDSRTQRVTGCGQTATYVARCEDTNFTEHLDPGSDSNGLRPRAVRTFHDCSWALLAASGATPRAE